MNFVIASQVVLWIAVLALALVCTVLARQIGVLHERIAPAGALTLRQALKVGEPVPELALATLDGAPVAIGGARGGRSQLLLFVSPTCKICESLLPSIRSAHAAERRWLDIVLASDGEPDLHADFVRQKGLGRFPYVVSERLGRTFGVSKLPYAALIDEHGRLAASGLVNTREHLESLFVAKESGVGTVQEFLDRDRRRQASSGE